jgi:hypothetical protein
VYQGADGAPGRVCGAGRYGGGGGGGGGGAGGVIALLAPEIRAAAGAIVSAAGGIGGGTDLTGGGGGRGGLGRIRVAVDSARCTLDALMAPPLARGCAVTTGAGEAGRAYVTTF